MTRFLLNAFFSYKQNFAILLLISIGSLVSWLGTFLSDVFVIKLLFFLLTVIFNVLFYVFIAVSAFAWSMQSGTDSYFYRIIPLEIIKEKLGKLCKTCLWNLLLMLSYIVIVTGIYFFFHIPMAMTAYGVVLLCYSSLFFVCAEGQEGLGAMKAALRYSIRNWPLFVISLLGFIIVSTLSEYLLHGFVVMTQQYTNISQKILGMFTINPGQLVSCAALIGMCLQQLLLGYFCFLLTGAYRKNQP